MSGDEIVERLEIKIKNPNPIFEKWLLRWLQEAERKNTKSQYALREALQALRNYPLPLASGRECAILRGFGATLCNCIDEELRQLELIQTTAGVKAATPITYEDAIQEVVRSVQKRKRKKAAKVATVKPPKPPTKAEQKARAEAEERARQVTMSPGSFRVLLLVDIQETNGRKQQRALDQTRSYLDTLAVPYEVRRLTVGDFLWIARDTDGNELVLPYIVERKRMDDFASSIRDGRFHEQKFRLTNSGIQNIIYLIEDYGDNEHIGLPLENLLQAAVNTQVQNDITVKHVENHWRAILYLKTMTNTLIKSFKDKLIIGTAKDELKPCHPKDSIVGLLKFRDLYEDSARNADLTVREVFVQQLLQLHSLSFDKALAIIAIYPTPRCLIDAYDACESEQQARTILSSVRSGKLERPIGDKISKALYDFYKTAF